MRVGTQGLFRPYLKTFFVPFLPTRLTVPGSLRMDLSSGRLCFHADDIWLHSATTRVHFVLLSYYVLARTTFFLDDEDKCRSMQNNARVSQLNSGRLCFRSRSIIKSFQPWLRFRKIAPDCTKKQQTEKFCWSYYDVIVRIGTLSIDDDDDGSENITKK